MHQWDDDRIYQRACLGLARNGHDVHLVATKPQEKVGESPVSFHWVPKRGGWKRRWYSSKYAIQLATRINAEVYHFHDPDLLPHVSKLKKALPHAVVVYDIHENYAGRFQNWGLPKWLGSVFRRYEWSVIRKINGYSVVSQSMNELFKKTGKPHVITRNSTDVSRLQGLDLDSIQPFPVPTVYTSGTHSHARKCLQTVQAIKYVDSAVAFQMMFAGRYSDTLKEELEEQAKQDGTGAILKLEGMLPWAENFQRTARACCGCVFYADNPNNRVGIPNRLFEYMFCGLPVIVTAFPELEQIVEKTACGLVVDSESPQAIAEAISFLLDHPEQARQMGENGRIAIQSEYGYHIDLERLEAFYQSLL